MLLIINNSIYKWPTIIRYRTSCCLCRTRLCRCNMIFGYFLDLPYGFSHYILYPNTDICCNHVHQPKSSQCFVAVYTHLKCVQSLLKDIFFAFEHKQNQKKKLNKYSSNMKIKDEALEYQNHKMQMANRTPFQDKFACFLYVKSFRFPFGVSQ